jgi:succinylglutamic semialdehyde dehydrogenase
MIRELQSTEPATGAVLWRGVTGDVEEEVATARQGWLEWVARPLTFRIETLRRFANVVRGRAEAFADLIARETGRPLWEARTEVESVVDRVEVAIAGFADRTSQRRLEGALGTRVAIRHKPHGVVAVIAPFAFPAQLSTNSIVPALVAGNAVLFKPSEKTPAVGEYLVDCFHAAGVPQAVIRCVIGGPDEGRALAGHPGVDAVLFTGSAANGQALHRQFSTTPHKLLALELGGNNPLVIWDTPDLYSAAVIAVQSAYLSSGQNCTSARRLIVRDGAHDPLIEQIGKLIDRIVVDHPHATPAPYMGPLIDNDAADRVQESFLDLILAGGRPLKQLVRPDADQPFLQPALVDVTSVADRPDEEIFGPVLQVIRVPDFDAAIAEANATQYGLVASVVCGDPALYDRFWANVRAGSVNWNRPTNGIPAKAPFGGVGLSGNHRPSGYYAADACAYPVVSAEAEQPRAIIGIGLRDG